MTQVAVLLTYDLVTPPGLHSLFRAQLEKRKWQFSLQGKALPNTTCWARFESGVTQESAKQVAINEIIEIERFLQNYHDLRFKVDRYTIVPISGNPAILSDKAGSVHLS